MTKFNLIFCFRLILYIN